MIEKRRNIRVLHDSSVKLVSGNHSVQGRMVDISRSGMKIAVRIPESFQTIKSVIFALPKSEKPIQIPYKLVRKETSRFDEGRQILGIEFSYEDETQMLPIESFIKERKMAQLKAQVKNAEMRQIPRTNCVINEVSSDKTEIYEISINNISIDGLSISYKGKGLSSHDNIVLTFKLAGAARDLTISGTVTYIVKSIFKDTFKAGIVFNNISEIDCVRIKNFISSYSAAMAMKALHEKFSAVNIDKRYIIHDQAKIASLFSLLNKDKIHMNVLFEDDYKMLELPVMHYDSDNQAFGIDKMNYLSNLNLKNGHLAYFTFSTQTGSYYFKTNLLENLARYAFFSLPDCIYFSEKRSHQRKIAGESIVFAKTTEEKSKGAFQGILINKSRHGFMCEVPFEQDSKDFFRPGRIVAYKVNEELGLNTYGEIRHVSENTIESGKKVLQIGIESGIKHVPFQFTRYSQEEWDKQILHPKDLPLSARDKMKSIFVKYPNEKGQKIAALINLTHSNITAPVIILPPAFGKKKEALSPLASTLITNSRCFNRDMVTIRYDGINLPGESYNEKMLPKRGYEMLNYRISQGQDDLQATIDHVYNNPLFKPSKVIVVAFSMSALDTRKLVSKSNDHRVDYLINVMGVPCGQTTFKNMTGGLDIIGYYKLGILNGQFGILGHILDLDNLAEDLITKKYAYMTEAKFDMTKISLPILWIYGKYDKWIDEQEVKELMRIESKGSREVIEIPTGHNLRSSQDAIKAFKLIAAWIHRKIYNEKIAPFEPDKDTLVNLIAYERERVTSSEDFNSEEYWKQYLIGKKGFGFGYDFYNNIKEFREFLTLESELVDLKDNERIADMGCGTGMLIEIMLNLAINQRKDIRNAQIIMVDLIKEALEKTKNKINREKKLHESLLPKNMNYIVKDLEPNRLIPVDKFISNIDFDFNFLRNRIEGLPNTTVDRLLTNSSKRLYEIMRGASIAESDADNIRSEFQDEDYQIITEFNRAARFLKGKLEEKDFVKPELLKSASSGSLKYGQLRTTDLKFTALNFGNHGLRLHLDFRKNYFDKIIASLLISYLFNPDEIFHDFYRMLKPNGLLIVSSMKPDSDISLIFTNYIDKVQHFDFSDTEIKSQDMSLLGAREILNEAATLFELEEEGYFKFFSEQELVNMFIRAGFNDVRVHTSLGSPPQALIVTGRKVQN